MRRGRTLGAEQRSAGAALRFRAGRNLDNGELIVELSIFSGGRYLTLALSKLEVEGLRKRLQEALEWSAEVLEKDNAT